MQSSAVLQYSPSWTPVHTMQSISICLCLCQQVPFVCQLRLCLSLHIQHVVPFYTNYSIFFFMLFFASLLLLSVTMLQMAMPRPQGQYVQVSSCMHLMSLNMHSTYTIDFCAWLQIVWRCRAALSCAEDPKRLEGAACLSRPRQEDVCLQGHHAPPCWGQCILLVTLNSSGL